jgi:hypothetical protein
MAEIDPSNIVSRRTRGKKIDYAKEAEAAGADLVEDDEEDDEEYVKSASSQVANRRRRLLKIGRPRNSQSNTPHVKRIVFVFVDTVLLSCLLYWLQPDNLYLCSYISRSLLKM